MSEHWSGVILDLCAELHIQILGICPQSDLPGAYLAMLGQSRAEELREVAHSLPPGWRASPGLEGCCVDVVQLQIIRH